MRNHSTKASNPFMDTKNPFPEVSTSKTTIRKKIEQYQKDGNRLPTWTIESLSQLVGTDSTPSLRTACRELLSILYSRVFSDDNLYNISTRPEIASVCTSNGMAKDVIWEIMDLRKFLNWLQGDFCGDMPQEAAEQSEENTSEKPEGDHQENDTTKNTTPAGEEETLKEDIVDEVRKIITNIHDEKLHGIPSRWAITMKHCVDGKKWGDLLRLCTSIIRDISAAVEINSRQLSYVEKDLKDVPANVTNKFECLENIAELATSINMLNWIVESISHLYMSNIDPTTDTLEHCEECTESEELGDQTDDDSVGISGADLKHLIWQMQKYPRATVALILADSYSNGTIFSNPEAVQYLYNYVKEDSPDGLFCAVREAMLEFDKVARDTIQVDTLTSFADLQDVSAGLGRTYRIKSILSNLRTRLHGNRDFYGITL